MEFTFLIVALNLLGITAAMTFSPEMAFAVANTSGANGGTIWPTLLLPTE
jgi:hypothetical protein